MGKYSGTCISFGTDIEYVLTDKYGNYRAAIPYIEGSKSAPQLLTGGNVQKDNVAFEVAIDYSTNSRCILNNIGSVFSEAYSLIPEGWELNAIPSAMFPIEELTDPIAQEFGCDPDFDAKTGKTNVMDTSEVHPNFRSFGLHIHTGSTIFRRDKTNELARYHVIASDFVLGLFSTIVDNSEAALDRRKLYGKPSAYRLKPYGVEYRTLSNFWSQSPDLMKLIMRLNDYAYWLAKVTNFRRLLSRFDIDQISQIIKDGDKIAAYNIWVKEVMPALRDTDHTLARKAMHKTDDYGSIKEEWKSFMSGAHKKQEHKEVNYA